MSSKYFKVKSGVNTPNVTFYSSTVNTSITASYLDSNVLSFSGTSGQLFSIADTMTGTIFAVNDISGVPSIEVDDDGTIRFAETFGNVLIGTATDAGGKLQVNGSISAKSLSVSGNATISSNGFVQVPSGTDAQRPDTPQSGMIRFNSTSNTFEGYNGISWQALGGAGNSSPITSQAIALAIIFSGY